VSSTKLKTRGYIDFSTLSFYRRLGPRAAGARLLSTRGLTVSTLSHPHIFTIYDTERGNDKTSINMEFMDRRDPPTSYRRQARGSESLPVEVAGARCRS
jgi:hypothetical protein